MPFIGDVGDPLQFATHLPAYVYHVLFRRYRPLVVVKLQNRRKRWFLGPRFVG